MTRQIILTRFDEDDIRRLADVLASVLDLDHVAGKRWWYAVAYCVLELLTERDAA